MSNATEQAAFNAWQQAHGSIFHLMLAYKFCDAAALRNAASVLQAAADTCFAALPEGPTPEAIAAAPRHLRQVIEAHRIAQEAAE